MSNKFISIIFANSEKKLNGVYMVDDVATYKQQWKVKLNSMNTISNSEIFCIYIANPFCAKKCKFCIYESSEIIKNQKDYRYYYDEFLINNIIDFKEVLQTRIPDSVYFGGGTPSLMSIDTMDKIFNATPNFRQIGYKYFEIHPAYFSLNKLKKLIEFGYNYISFGIQTIDSFILSEQNRTPFSLEKMLKYIDEANMNNIIVNCDLMAFLHDDLEKDLESLKYSLNWVLKKLQPQVIDIYPCYQRVIDNPSNEIEKENNYSLGYSLRRSILDVLEYNQKYKYSKNMLSLNRDDILNHARYNYRLYTMEENEYRRIKIYNSSGPSCLPFNQNVLSFGGFKEQKPYSYISKDKCWINVNNNWKMEYHQAECHWNQNKIQKINIEIKQ